jgi:hypothetical protein
MSSVHLASKVFLIAILTREIAWSTGISTALQKAQGIE